MFLLLPTVQPTPRLAELHKALALELTLFSPNATTVSMWTQETRPLVPPAQPLSTATQTKRSTIASPAITVELA